MQRVPTMEADEEGGACGNATKDTAREEAGMPCKGRSAGKEVEEDGTGGDGARGQATKSIARMEEEFSRRIEEEGRGALWERRSRRGAIMGARLVYEGGGGIVLDLQVQREGVPCRGQLEARSDPLLEVGKIKLVWMQREDREKSGVAQRGKSTAK